MLIIYTGDGKGKTTAAIGQTVRAKGQGFRVAFGQFMKRGDQAGEQQLLPGILGPDMFAAMGEGFFRNEKEREKHREAALRLLDWAREKLDAEAEPGLDMLVLDETLYALGTGLLDRAEVEDLCDRAQRAGAHLVLTGRGLTDWLRERADLVTETHQIKHPYEQGITAQKGVEY